MVIVLLTGTSWAFLREIPLFNSFEIESYAVTWDDQWLYILSRFLTVPSSTSSASLATTNKFDQSRQLSALALSKTCYKVARHPRSVRPGRVLSLGGYGPDSANWKRAKAFRQKNRRAAREWLTSEDDQSDGLEMYEERRRAALLIVDRLGGGQKARWLALAEV